MRLVIFLSCAVAAVLTAPAEPPATILRYDNENDGLGNYNFAFETSDGISRKEQSEVVNAGDPENESIIVRGSYSYTGPDGVVYTVNYVADENGFHPTGDHIPSVGEEGSVLSTSSPPAYFPIGLIESLAG